MRFTYPQKFNSSRSESSIDSCIVLQTIPRNYRTYIGLCGCLLHARGYLNRPEGISETKVGEENHTRSKFLKCFHASMWDHYGIGLISNNKKSYSNWSNNKFSHNLKKIWNDFFPVKYGLIGKIQIIHHVRTSWVIRLIFFTLFFSLERGNYYETAELNIL